MPRFLGDSLAANLKLQAAYNAIAADAGCTPAQLALAWLLHKAPHIVPIPGTTSVAHLLEDVAAADIRLSAETLQRVEATVNQHTVVGSRYPAQASAEVDTETF
jgi:aryl-alcohol dehydrogenase-like predicted oxidoreductase